MKSTLRYDGIKYEDGSLINVKDFLSIEQALQISINETPFTVVMQTPGDELELAIGLMYAEDVLKKNYLPHFTLRKNKHDFIEEINLSIPAENLGSGYLSARSLLSVSSCGICGKQSLDDLKISGDELKGDVKFSPIELFKMQTNMFDNQVDFRSTGGCHGVAAYNSSGKLLVLKEDIGRHNALDKVVGTLLIKEELNEAKVLCFSGRLSYELISKAFRAKISVIIAVSAPTSLAIDFAKEYGITLVAFARGNKLTCYAGPQRIKIAP